MRILLTGASGFVGRAVLAALGRQSIETIAISRTPPPIEGDFQWYGIDLLDHGAASHLMKAVQPDLVIHLAWNVEHGRFWTSPENLDWMAATLNLAHAAKQAGTKRFIGTGTCYEYDWPSGGACRENQTPLKPSALYGSAKDTTRQVLGKFCRVNDLSFAWARLFFLFGPEEGEKRLVPSVAKALVAGEPARCSSGTGVRDFMDVRDAAEALVKLALSEVTVEVNIASGVGTSVADVAKTLGRLAATPELVHIGALADRPNEPPQIIADVTRLREEVGYQPARGLEDGLADALTYWRQAGVGG